MATAAIGAASVPVTAGVGASAVACGSVLTADTVLSGDLSCPGDALTIAAPGVTLDLNGHAVTGPGREAPSRTGVYVLATARGATVTGGTIADYSRGVVAAPGADDVTISRLTVTSTFQAVSIDAARATVRENAIWLSGTAIRVHGDDTRVEANTVTLTGTGVFVTGGRTRTTGNRISGDAQDSGIIAAGAEAVVAGNVVSGTIAGILIGGAETNVSHNTAVRNVVGVIVVAGSATVEANIALFNATDGIRAASIAGVVVAGNLTAFNGDLGIEAPGAVDGGGNRGFANANPAQCAGVTCA